jgi:transcriptional regulator with XRE-family HTH domain
MTAQDYLKAIRATGLTQAQVAERTGIPQGTISKIETGLVKDVLSKTYIALQALHGELLAPKRRASDKAGA